MKKLVSIFLTLVLASGLYAQEAKKVTYANKKQYDDFFNSKTMVVLDADPFSGFNMAAPDVMKKYWTITPYEIIPANDFDKKRSDPSLSFIFLSKVQMAKDKKAVFYLYMDVVMGAKTKDIINMPVLISIPLAYTGVDEDDYLEKLPLMIRFVQLHINNQKVAKNLQTLNNLKNYSDESKALKDMILLVKESDLAEEVNTVEKIQKDYPGQVKIVTSEEMAKAIDEHAPNTAVLHQLGPAEDENKGRSFCQIFGAEDAKLYYYNHQDISQRRPEGMCARDFRLILGKWF